MPHTWAAPLKRSGFLCCRGETISEARQENGSPPGVVSRSRIKIGQVFAKGKWSREPHGCPRKPSGPAVLREGSAQEAGHTRPRPGLRRSLSSVPSVSPALPTALECLHSLAGKRVSREAFARGCTRPCWGSETSSDGTLSWVPTRLPIPGWVQPGPGQHRAGKTWGDWPRPPAPWPQHAIHVQGPGLAGGAGGARPWTSPGMCAF